MTVAVFFADPV